MNILGICKTVLRGCMSMAVVMLLSASLTTLYAQDQDKDKDKDKVKKKDSTPAKSAPAQKPSASAEKQKASAPAQTDGGNTRAKSGGENTANKSGGTNTTGKSGGTQTTGNTGGTSSTGNSGGTNKDRKTAGGTTSNTGGTSTPGNTGGTSSTGNSGGTNKDRKNAGATTGNTGGTNTTGKPGKNATSNTGGTSTTGDSGGTSTAGKSGRTNAARKASGDVILSGGRDKTTSASPGITSPGITRGATGKVEVYRGHNGSEARFRRDGSVREVHARDMTIIHGPGGSRRIVVERVDHSRVVAYRGGYGYVQRPFLYRGQEFASRTYLYRGRPYAAYYQRYPYRGVFLEGYRPYRYYRPAFYGWAYNPWRSPVRYSWGWAGNPWYGYYGSYFTPYSVYPSASFWLTDYFIASSLQAAYQQRADDRAYFAGNPGDPVVLTPEIKEAIASEVQSQLALENSEGQRAAQGGDVDINSSGLPRILAEASPNHPHVFVVAGPLEVTDSGGQECGLTAGDVLRLSNATPPDSTAVYLQVFASKNQECPRGTTVSVELADLQEMQNNMRASIDQGLQELQSHEGGLPAPPPSAAAPPVQASFAPIAPPADPNVSNELQQQAREADTAEKGVLDELKQEDNTGGVRDPNIPSNTPVQISLGQTIAEVVAALGNPKRIVNLDAKRIYVYSDIKITFTNGKVTNVE
jgi:hypothetical protein